MMESICHEINTMDDLNRLANECDYLIDQRRLDLLHINLTPTALDTTNR
jgi:hypothetical protein